MVAAELDSSCLTISCGAQSPSANDNANQHSALQLLLRLSQAAVYYASIPVIADIAVPRLRQLLIRASASFY